MKSEHLSDAIGCIDEKMIAQTEAIRKKKRKPRWLAWTAAAACIALAIAFAKPIFTDDATQSKTPLGKPQQTVLLDADTTSAGKLIARAEYPQMMHYPNGLEYENDWDAYTEALDAWYEDKANYQESIETPENENYFDAFYRKSAEEFLTNSQDENVVYSPSNVYMALAMLAELTDGQSRQQILELLGAEDIEVLRTDAKHLWKTNYCDNGQLTTVMANSLWLSDGLSYNQSTMDRIAEEYYASSYSGVMGSEEYSALLRQWLNEQTGDLLKDQVEDLGFDPRTVMALASTIYFKGRWADVFSESATKPDVFHATNGDTTIDFMHGYESGNVYWGESFSAIQKCMNNDASMWLILPDEDKSIEDVLSDGEIFEMTAAGAQWQQSKSVQINLKMPKFDVSSNLDLVGGLQNMGITDVFDPAVSDFTPMSDEIEDVYVSRAEHAARVLVDEEGCTAAAYTVIMTEATGAFIGDEIDFVLDRPFIFVITGCGDQPLFIGVVNQV